MFNIVINNDPAPIGRVEFVDLLNGYTSAVVYPAGRCPAPARGAAITLAMDKGDFKFPLVVDDYWLGAVDGGWLKLIAPAAHAPRYDAEVFSGADESNFKKVIESRTPVNGPPELDRKLPAIVADCTLADLLSDVCSRTAGWAWWTGTNGIEIGLPNPDTVRTEGFATARTAWGCEVNLEAPPRPGTNLLLPGNVSGVVLRAQVQWRAGHEPIYSALLGAIPASHRRPPRRTLHWLAKVIQLDPFLVEASDEERPGRVFKTRARLMARRSDKNRFREDVPIQVDDVFEAAIPTGGVSVLPVKVYQWTHAMPASAYRFQSQSAEVVIADKVTTSAIEIEETFNRRTSHVKQRWDVKKS